MVWNLITTKKRSSISIEKTTFYLGLGGKITKDIMESSSPFISGQRRRKKTRIGITFSLSRKFQPRKKVARHGFDSWQHYFCIFKIEKYTSLFRLIASYIQGNSYRVFILVWWSNREETLVFNILLFYNFCFVLTCIFWNKT